MLLLFIAWSPSSIQHCPQCNWCEGLCVKSSHSTKTNNLKHHKSCVCTRNVAIRNQPPASIKGPQWVAKLSGLANKSDLAMLDHVQSLRPSRILVSVVVVNRINHHRDRILRTSNKLFGSVNAIIYSKTATTKKKKMNNGSFSSIISQIYQNIISTHQWFCVVG